MEFKRKQHVLRQRFWFRMAVCVVSLVGSILYLICNDASSLWGMLIGVCGSALVWSLVELFDFFVQTYYQHESERNVFWGISTDYFGRMKSVIRANNKEVPMHELKTIVNELYEEMNNFIFNSNVYPISREFDMYANYIERMYWKFDACCSGIYDDCEERSEYYQKLYNSLILKKEEKEATSKRFFDGFFAQKSLDQMTDIELSFEHYDIPQNIVDEEVVGNLGESFTIPGNVRITTTFIPDIDFRKLYHDNKSNAFRTVICLLFRKVRMS